VKKTEQQTYRLSEPEKEALAKIAAEMDMPAASLVASLAARFIKARETHGTRLIWPPEFNHYPASSKSTQEQADSEAEDNP